MITIHRGSETFANWNDVRIRIDWSRTDPTMIVNQEKPQAMTRLGAFFFADVKNLRVWTGKTAPDSVPELPDEGREAIYMPFQGWVGDRWFDGPILRFAANGLTDIVLAGRAGELRIGGGQDVLDGWRSWAEEEIPFALKDSFIQAYRSLNPGDGSHRAKRSEVRWVPDILSAGDFDTRSVFHLTLARIAFPDNRLFLHEKHLTPPWKRLCQNLNIEIPRQFTPIPSEAPSTVADDDVIREFLLFLQKRAPYVPEGLARELGIYS